MINPGNQKPHPENRRTCCHAESCESKTCCHAESCGSKTCLPRQDRCVMMQKLSVRTALVREPPSIKN